MLTKKWIAVAAAALMLAVAGCKSGPADVSTPAGSSSAQGTAGPGSDTPQPTEPPAPSGDLNRLTGLYDLEKGAPNRPLTVMIGNNDRSRPQVGLDKADMYFEAETEGGITRIMAVFANPSRVPEKLGPIRSARTPFVKLTQSLDGIYAHFGGSVCAKAMINDMGINHIDGITYDGSTYWRDEQLRKTKGLEYSAMTSGEKIQDRANRMKFAATTDHAAPFVFGEKTGSIPAANVMVYISRLQQVNFQYNTADKLYYKYNGTDQSDPHKTADGVQLSATNVIVMYDHFFQEIESQPITYSFTLEKGSGYLYSGGAGRAIKWSRSAGGLKYTEEDGSVLTVSPGKTYVCLVNEVNSTKAVIR